VAPGHTPKPHNHSGLTKAPMKTQATIGKSDLSQSWRNLSQVGMSFLSFYLRGVSYTWVPKKEEVFNNTWLGLKRSGRE